jgi:hypothetical protein
MLSIPLQGVNFYNVGMKKGYPMSPELANAPVGTNSPAFDQYLSFANPQPTTGSAISGLADQFPGYISPTEQMSLMSGLNQSTNAFSPIFGGNYNQIGAGLGNLASLVRR